MDVKVNAVYTLSKNQVHDLSKYGDELSRELGD